LKGLPKDRSSAVEVLVDENSNLKQENWLTRDGKTGSPPRSRRTTTEKREKEARER